MPKLVLRRDDFGRENFLENLERVCGIFSENCFPALGPSFRLKIRTQGYHVEFDHWFSVRVLSVFHLKVVYLNLCPCLLIVNQTKNSRARNSGSSFLITSETTVSWGTMMFA